MAYADIGDIATGAVITEGYLDQIRANFQAGVPDIFTTKGDIAAATAADAAARLAVGADDAMLVADASTATGLAWQIQPACRVYNDAALDPNVGSWGTGTATLTFNSERFDTDAMHSTSTNTSRLVVPAGGDGIYQIGACIEFATGDDVNDNSVVGVRIVLNGATVIAQQLHNYYRAETRDICLTISALYSLVATDYVQCQVFTDRDININASANYSPEFWAIWQRRA